VRFHVDISPGGRFQPSVVIQSCRLLPYSTPVDGFRCFLEVVFAVFVAYYWAVEIFEMRSVPTWGSYFCSVWNWIELINLTFYVIIISFWFVLYIAEDKTPFQEVSSATYEQRPDLSVLAKYFNYTSDLAAFNIIFAYVKVFKYLQMYPSLSQLWRTLELSMRDILPFFMVLMLFTGGFTFAGHWIFGFMMVEFHSLTRSFSTLVQTVNGGLPFDEMRMFQPVAAYIFTIAWILVMVMVLVNMFVAILSEWHGEVSRENNKENMKLMNRVGKNAKYGFFGGLFRYVYTRLAGGKDAEAAGNDTLLETIYDYDDRTREVAAALKTADLRYADHIRKCLIDGKKVGFEDIVKHFGGNEEKAHHFVNKLQDLIGSSSRSGAMKQTGNADWRDEEEEVHEQHRLQALQTTVVRLENQLRQLRGALHDALVAPAADPKSLGLKAHEKLPLPPPDGPPAGVGGGDDDEQLGALMDDEGHEGEVGEAPVPVAPYSQPGSRPDQPDPVELPGSVSGVM